MADKIDSITPPPANASAIVPGTLDKHGTAWNPQKHLAKTHPVTKAWLPKGGYTKEARAANAAKKAAGGATPPPPANPPAVAAAAPTPPPDPAAIPAAPVAIETTTADPTRSTVESMAMNMPDVTAESGKPKTDAPEASFIPSDDSLPPLPPKEGDDAAPGAIGARPAGAAPSAPVDEGDPDADAEIALEVLFDLIGLGTGHYDEARPVPSRVTSMRKVLSAWFKKRGWASVGGWAVLVSFLAYFSSLMRQPKTGATVRRWLGMGKKDDEAARAAAAKNVTPAPAVPASAAAATGKTSTETPIVPFAGIATE